MSQNIRSLYRYLKMIPDYDPCRREEFVKNYINERLQNSSSTIHLVQIGKGSSRTVFDIKGTKYVLKVAHNIKGVAQNKSEVQPIFKKYKNFFAEIFKHDSKSFTWLIMEKGAPIEHLSKEGVNTLALESLKRGSASLLKSVKPVPTYTQDLMKVLKKVNREINLSLPGDFVYECSYAKVGNRLKIVDYGFNKKVYKKHYKDNWT